MRAAAERVVDFHEVRLLTTALEEPELRRLRAKTLVGDHTRRNQVARKSHARTWRARHQALKFPRL